MLYALRNALYAGAAFPIGLLADRLGRRGLLAAGYLVAALTFIGFIRAGTDLSYLAMLFASAGVFMAVEDTLEGAIAGELLPAETIGQVHQCPSVCPLVGNLATVWLQYLRLS